jgi:hypothetical protein
LLSILIKRTGDYYYLTTFRETDHHDITEMLLKVALNTLTLTLNKYFFTFSRNLETLVATLVLDADLVARVYSSVVKPGYKISIKYQCSKTWLQDQNQVPV